MWEQSPHHPPPLVLLSSAAPGIKESKAGVTPGALSPRQDKQAVWWCPSGTQIQVGGSWSLGPAPAWPGPGSASGAVFICLLRGQRLRGLFRATAGFYCTEAQKRPEHIFREKGGEKKDIFFLTQDEGSLQFSICSLSLLGGAGGEVSLLEDLRDSGL